MSSPAGAACALCGADGPGPYCSGCGAAKGAVACRGCGAAVLPGARFCPACGYDMRRSSQGGRTERTPWIVAGIALVALLIVVLVMVSRTTSPPADTAAMGPDPVEGDGPAAPDISTLSPRERFDRLYNRVMRAAQAGDEATVSRFTPMAMMAYAQLDSVDADARYHAALLAIHNGDVAGPTALADTILARQPGHLFGYIIRGTVARWNKDDPALARAYAGFLEHYDAELRAARPEYAEHRTSVDEFHRQAIRGQSAAAP